MVAEFAEPSIETITEKKDMDGKSVGAILVGGTLHWKVYVVARPTREDLELG